jgi:hypothetical protein
MYKATQSVINVKLKAFTLHLASIAVRVSSINSLRTSALYKFSFTK